MQLLIHAVAVCVREALIDPTLESSSSKECGAHLDAKEELLLTFNTICLNVQSFGGFKTVAEK